MAVQVSLIASIAVASQQAASASATAQELTNKIAAQEEIEMHQQESLKKLKEELAKTKKGTIQYVLKSIAASCGTLFSLIFLELSFVRLNKQSSFDKNVSS